MANRENSGLKLSVEMAYLDLWSPSVYSSKNCGGWAFFTLLNRKLMQFYNTEGFKTALPWITLVIGLSTFSFGTFSTFTDPLWGEFYSGIGKTILAGGIFALLLKTYQFMGVFKDELSKIIYDAKHLNNRKDLPEIWENVSKIMFKNKFDSISKDITRDVKNIYFPTDQVSYFDNYKQILTIELVDPENDIVKVTQQAEYTVYPNDASSKLNLSFNNSLIFNNNREEVSFKIISFRINEASYSKYKLTSSVEGKILRNKVSMELQGQLCYKIETEIEKTYCLKYDNIIGFKKESLIHDFNIKIIPKGVKISFLSSGTLKEFDKVNVKGEHFCEYVYKGIIYPKQGYTIFIRN